MSGQTVKIHLRRKKNNSRAPRSPLLVTILWLFTAQPVHDESLGDESDGAVGRVERGHNVAGVAVNLEHKQR